MLFKAYCKTEEINYFLIIDVNSLISPDITALTNLLKSSIEILALLPCLSIKLTVFVDSSKTNLGQNVPAGQISASYIILSTKQITTYNHKLILFTSKKSDIGIALSNSLSFNSEYLFTTLSIITGSPMLIYVPYSL